MDGRRSEVPSPVRPFLLHPRLLSVISQFTPPSPYRLPKDLEQPASGYLRTFVRSEVEINTAKRSLRRKADEVLKRRKIGNETLAPVLGKGEVTLNINGSALMERRMRRSQRQE